MSKITNVVTLKTYAETHGLDVKRLRRIARKNDWPNDNTPFKFGGDDGIWAIDANAPAIELPDKSTRGTRRPDGRQRYIVFANTVELATVVGIVGNDNVVNPRVVAKSRRDARKLAAMGECECCGEYAKLHLGNAIVGGRDYGQCRICDDCAISDNEYHALVAELENDADG